MLCIVILTRGDVVQCENDSQFACKVYRHNSVIVEDTQHETCSQQMQALMYS